jgi:hypothetical protein
MARIGFGIKRLTPDSGNYAAQPNSPFVSQNPQPPVQQPQQMPQNPAAANPHNSFMQQNSYQNTLNRSAQPNPGQTAQKSGSSFNTALNKEEVAKKAAEIHQSTLLKQQKMRFMKSFIELKRKIYQLIELGKPEEARDTYDNLFLLYQEMARNVKEEEIVSIKTDIAVVYHNLEQAINKKKIKKGIFKEVDNNKGNAEKLYRDKIVTTDLDSIMQIVEERGKMNLAEIETKFNIPRRLAEEWIQILADYGLVEIRYLPIGGIEINKISK